jgi:hypothetical protein
MAEGLDLGVCAAHIYTKLTAAAGLTGLGVYEGIAPDDAADTFVSFEYLQEDRPVTMGVGAIYFMSRPRYKVIATGEDVSYATLRTYGQAIYNALHKVSSALATGTITTVAVSPFQQEDPEEGGVIFRHAGWIVEAYTRSE